MDPWKAEPPRGPNRRPASFWPGAVAMALATLLLGLFMAGTITAQTLYPLLMLVIAIPMGYLILIDVEPPPWHEVPPPPDIASVWPPRPDNRRKRRGKGRNNSK
ncbi:hypothetical protein SCLO_1029830 [Sphingobium cloacae]|uniref:Uncharacterized protein n=2 Tax=Sphingobium cloacae TaxID=120107 RepID=A0A1E1F675_9SPHN|nr:hypothetical protein SCLO_1029830 [Sphingobium cloacae]